MSEWVDRIENHEIFNTFESLNKLLDENRVKAEKTSTEAIDALDRVSSGVRHIESLLNRVDPILIVPSSLNQLNASLNKISASMALFKQTSGLVHLISGNTQLDTALPQLSTIHVLATPSDVDNLREASSSFRRSCAQLNKNLEIEIEKTLSTSENLKTKLDELSTEITNQKTRLDDAITNFTESFNTSQSKRTEEFSSFKEQFKTDVSDFINKSQNSFTIFMSESKENLTQLHDDMNSEHLTLLKTTEENNNNTMKDIEKHKTEAERLVGIISMTGMVGGYQKVANKEKSAFVRWRIGTVICMILLVTFGVYTFYTTVSENFDSAIFANRLFVTVTLALLSGYSALQADRHRKAEVENRRMELELASFDPFLASLTDEERNELKKNMAERIFGRHATSHKNNEQVSPNALVDLLKQALESIGKSKN